MTRSYNAAMIDARAHLEAGIVPMMWGAGGIGKSAMYQAIADDMGIPLLDSRPSDLASGTTRWLQPDDFPRVDRDGPRGIWLFDEISACSLPVQVALYQLIWDGALGEYRKPKGWLIACAGNRVQDRAAAQRFSTALNNRVAHIDVEVDHFAWIDWGALNGIHPLLLAFIRWRSELLFKFSPELREYPSPRSWTLANRHIGNKDRASRLRLMGQIVGKSAAGEFEAFADIAAELEPVSVILANPMGARVPEADKLAAQYAVTVALAMNIDKKTARAGAAYVKRLPSADCHALFASLVTTRNPALASYGFADLVTGNANI